MLTIGRVETIAIPGFQLENIEAKIDTGAFHGAICSKNIQRIKKGKGDILRFALYSNGKKGKLKYFETPAFEETVVKSSFGQKERRYKIFAGIKIGSKTYKTGLTLSDRSELKYPVLLGRKFIRNRFLVDVSKKNMLNK